MRSQVAQFSFSAGEIDPHLHDRVDLDAYYAGAAEMNNFIPLPHGPLVRRKGTHFIAEAAYTADYPGIRLIPFVFNLNQSFCLELTPNKLRVYYNGGLVLATNGAPLSVTTPWGAPTLQTLNWAQHGDWLYVVDGTGTVHPQAIKRYSNTDWRVEQLSFTNRPAEWTTNNWPITVQFFQQRAYYAGTPKQPQQIWASRTGLYEEFTYLNPSGEAADDFAFTYTIFSNDVNGVKWMIDMGGLILGTSGAEYKVGAISSIDPVTPKNLDISAQTHYGSAFIRPVAVGSNIVFAQRSKNRVRAFEYSFSEDRFTANDLTMFASHILEGRIREMVLQTAPDSYIWVCDELGNLIGCTYEKQQKILAWHRHVTDGKIVALCIVPSEDNDELWLAVKRIVNGQERLYVEALWDFWESVSDVTDAFYVDSGLSYEGPAVDTLAGLQHLNGKEVQILCDGWVHPPQVVVNGQVQLQQEVTKCHIGLPMESNFVSMIPQAQDELTIGATRRIFSATVALEQSLDFEYGATGETSYDRAYDGPTPVMNQAIPLTSRHQEIQIRSKSNTTQQLKIRQNLPVPLIIRGIVYRINPSKV